MSSLTKEASEKFNAIKQSNPGMTTNQALIASGAGSMVDLNNKLYDTGVSSSDVPAYSNPMSPASGGAQGSPDYAQGSQPTQGSPDYGSGSDSPYSPEEMQGPEITPLDFGKKLLNQVVGIEENPNNLSSERVLQLVRQGFSKPDFIYEYLNSGGTPPQYSVLSDSEYMEAYRTDQVPDKRDMEPLPQPLPEYDPQPQPQPQPTPQPLPTQGSSPSVPDFINPATGQPYGPGDPNSPFYQGSLPPTPINPNINPPPINPGSPPIMSPPPGMGLPPMRPPISSFGPPMSPGMGLPPMVPSESLLQGDFGGSLPMYGSPPTQQGYNYDPSVMAKLLQQVMSKQT